MRTISNSEARKKKFKSSKVTNTVKLRGKPITINIQSHPIYYKNSILDATYELIKYYTVKKNATVTQFLFRYLMSPTQ